MLQNYNILFFKIEFIASHVYCKSIGILFLSHSRHGLMFA